MQSENLDQEGLTQTFIWINEINPNDRFLTKRQALNI